VLLRLLWLRRLIERVTRWLFWLALLAQRIRAGRPDRQRTHSAAADEVTVAVHAHIDHIFRRVSTSGVGVWFAR
jgi:hypothetical protein